MKNSSFLMGLMLGLFMSVFTLTACSSDDNEDNGTNSSMSLVGTEWSYTTPKNDIFLVSVRSTTLAHVTVISSDGNILEESDYQYSYNAATGIGRVVANNGQYGTFVVTGDIMTCKAEWVDWEMTFKRIK